MFAYDLRLALLSMKRHPGLAALMVLAVALGIAVCTVTFTIYHAMSTNPIKWKSDNLYAVTVDSWDPKEPADDDQPEMPPSQLTYRDAVALQQSDIPARSAIMFKSDAVVDSARKGTKPFRAILRVTTADFFGLFDVPFLYGSGWTDAADQGPEPGRGAEPREQRQGVRRREQRRPHRPARRPGVPRRGRARQLVAEPEVLRPEQRIVRGRRGCLHPVPLGRGERDADGGQHQLLEERGHRVGAGFPQLGVRLDPDVGRTREREGSRPLPGLRRQLRARAEGIRPPAAPAQQPALRRRPVAGFQPRRQARQPRADRYRTAVPRRLSRQRGRAAARQVPERRGAHRAPARARREPGRHPAPAPGRGADRRRWRAARSGCCSPGAGWPAFARSTRATTIPTRA